MKKSLFLLFMLCWAYVVRAQQFVMLPLPNQQKLPQSELYRIFEDSEGYMWYATQGAGLCRDNGYQVDVFRSDRNHPDLLFSNVVTCIAENVQAREIWFGTKQGGYVLSKRDYSIRFLKGVTSHVHDVVQAPDGSMWVAASKQMKVFAASGELQDSFALSWKGRPMSVETMTLDSRGVLWIMQWDGGVQTIDTHTRQLQTMNWEEAVGPTSLAEDSVSHRYYVGTWGQGVYLYDGRQTDPLTPDLVTPMQRKVRSVHYDRWRHMLWAVTMAGIYAYTIEADGRLTPCTMAELGISMPQQAVYQLVFDRWGNVWVPGTTPLSFILRPTGGKWMHRMPLDGLTREAGVQMPVGAFQTDGRYCWLWSDRTQLVLYDLQSSRVAMVKGTPDKETTRFGDILARRREGGVWCATGRLVYACDCHDMRVQLSAKPAVAMRKTVSALCETADGRLLIGTAEGLYCCDIATGQITTLCEGTRTVRDIVALPSGRIFFISVEKGLCTIDGRQDCKVLAPYQRYTSLACSADGRLWVANAYGDVWTLKNDTLRYVPVASNQQSNGVKRLVCDSLGHLWVMGDTYLIEYHPESDRRRLFLSSDQQIGMDNFGGIGLTDDGNIYVAGAGALVVLQPKPLTGHGADIRPSVAAYAVDGRKQLLSNANTGIEIPADAVMLQLELTDFNYLKADNQQFAYRLLGLSDQWRELPMGENRLELLNLHKGRYTLELRVCDSYGHWGEPVKALSIYRQPAWFETWLAYLVYLLLVAGAMVWGVKLYLRRSKEKTQRQMDEKLTEMKLRFFTNVSHELRTPLSLIITPLESIVKNEKQVVKSDLEKILRHANGLLDLVNRLLDFRKLDMGELKLHLMSGDVLEFLRSCVGTFLPMAQSKGITLVQDIPEGALYTDFDTKAMQHVMYNLLSNAMKYTDEGTVKLAVKPSDNGTLTIIVSDTGSGIAPDELPHVFDRYYQAANADDTSVAGSGIGLNMVKELVAQMDGQIGVESELGKGSVFTVVLPLSPQEQEKDELPAAPVVPKLPSLLIADDNDDFRDFLVGELKDDYNIIQARNGREALKMVQTHYVDVILSDVMMPQMDGNELCRQLKQDESTSHIFVMLLTAKSAEESMMESYEAGADFYLTKPFSLELLRNRLQHLAHLQERRIEMLTARNAQKENCEEEDLHISPFDRKFMDKMKSTMERHLSDSTFSVDVFCSEVGMSRMNFYRKMNALTGMTPAQYINDYRLTLADRLLREGELNVSEVADRTGFATPSYFSKCYKSRYGIAPKDVRAR